MGWSRALNRTVCVCYIINPFYDNPISYYSQFILFPLAYNSFSDSTALVGLATR